MVNDRLLNAVPAEALSILEVGCGTGALGLALKQAGPAGRRVVGIEPDEPAAAAARAGLDEVQCVDLVSDFPRIEAAGFDCVILNGILERVPDPLALVQHLRPALKEGGLLFCSVSNAQNFAFISALFTNDFQYRESGIPDRRHLRLFTLSTIYKLLLDAEFLPQLIHTAVTPCDPELWQAIIPFANYFNIDPHHIHVNLSAYQYVLAARPLPAVPQADEPMSFVACSNDPEQLANNLAASPCFGSGRHELIVITDATSAGQGLNEGLSRAKHRLVVAAHQDVYIPHGWPARFQHQWALAEQRFGALGVAGVFGVSDQGGVTLRTGQAINAGQLIASGFGLPAEASSLDEIVLALPKETALRFDPVVGWHNYGTDIVLESHRAGLPAAILEAPCLHNTRFAGLRQDFLDSAQALSRKWEQKRPFHTTCVRVDAEGNLFGW